MLLLVAVAVAVRGRRAEVQRAVERVLAVRKRGAGVVVLVVVVHGFRGAAQRCKLVAALGVLCTSRGRTRPVITLALKSPFFPYGIGMPQHTRSEDRWARRWRRMPFIMMMMTTPTTGTSVTANVVKNQPIPMTGSAAADTCPSAAAHNATAAVRKSTAVVPGGGRGRATHLRTDAAGEVHDAVQEAINGARGLPAFRKDDTPQRDRGPLARLGSGNSSAWRATPTRAPPRNFDGVGGQAGPREGEEERAERVEKHRQGDMDVDQPAEQNEARHKRQLAQSVHLCWPTWERRARRA